MSARHAAVLAILLASLTACEKKKAGAQAGNPAPAAAPATDWSKVAAAEPGEAMMTYKTIARRCDGWFKGARPDIILRFESGSATDGAGHSTPITVEQWKAVVIAARVPATVAAASKSSFYSSGPQADSFGTIPRYKYEIQAVDDATLKFHNAGLLDDGK